MKIRYLCQIVFLIIALFAQCSLEAQIPQLLEYDGYLLEKGKPATGNRTMSVRLYDARTGGKILYRENIGLVRVVKGEFYFQYGQKGVAGNGTASTGIIPALTGNQHWLAVIVNGTEQSPRAQFLPVPFALASADAQNLAKKLAALELEVQNLKKTIPSGGVISTSPSWGSGIQLPWGGLMPSTPSSGSVIKSKVDGVFNGWSGSTLVSLTNGQIWQQSEYYYDYDYSYRPDVTIIKDSTGYKMFVEGIDRGVRVTRLD